MHRVEFAEPLTPPRRDDRTDGSQCSRAGVPAHEEPARGNRGHDDPHGSHDRVRAATPLPVRRRVRLAVPVRAAALLVPAADLDGLHQLRRARAAGGQLPDDLRRARPARRVLRAGRDPRDRPQRDRDRARGRGRHRDHRRSRRTQDPRGARRAAGARRRSDQEPGRPALPGADDRDRAVRHLRAAVRPVRRDPRGARQRPAARAVLGDVLRQRRPPPTCGARC